MINIKTFDNLLMRLVNEDYPTKEEILEYKIQKSKEFNTNYIGQHIFYPCDNYEEEYSKYKSLPYNRRVLSNSACIQIWSVDNTALYNLWYDHVNKINMSTDTDKLKDMVDDLIDIEDDNEEKLSNTVTILTPDIMKAKGINNIAFEDNYYKCKPSIDKLDNGLDIKKWFKYYEDHYNGISSIGWNKNYISWKATVKRLCEELNNIDLSKIESDKIRQSLLSLGWVAGIPFNDNIIIQFKVKRTDRKKIVDVSDILLDESADYIEKVIPTNYAFIIFAHSELKDNKCTPYFSIDMNTFYSVDLSKKYINATNYIASIFGIQLSDDIVEKLKSIDKLDIKEETLSPRYFEDDSFDFNTIKYKVPNIFGVIIKNIINLGFNELQHHEILNLTNANTFLLFKKIRYNEIKRDTFFYKLNSMNKMLSTVTEQSGLDIINSLEKNPSKLNLIRLKPVADKLLKGTQLNLFNTVYENYIGKDSISDVIINEMSDIKGINMINESSSDIINSDYYTEVYNRIESRIEESMNDKYVLYDLWKLNNILENKIYGDIDDRDKGRLYLLRNNTLSLFNEVNKSLEYKDPTFDINKFITELSLNENNTIHENQHIKYSTNLINVL